MAQLTGEIDDESRTVEITWLTKQHHKFTREMTIWGPDSKDTIPPCVATEIFAHWLGWRPEEDAEELIEQALRIARACAQEKRRLEQVKKKHESKKKEVVRNNGCRGLVGKWNKTAEAKRLEEDSKRIIALGYAQPLEQFMNRKRNKAAAASSDVTTTEEDEDTHASKKHSPLPKTE
jgi:hypothetical protein